MSKLEWNAETFEKLYNLDITKYIKKDYKGLKYLSWANAYRVLKKYDPNATHEILKAEDNLPFFTRVLGEGQAVNFVYTNITAFGITKQMYLPVMDNRHKAVAIPDSRQVNDAIQRCLAKNIALFGIGLSLYTREGLEGYGIAEKVSETQIMKYVELKNKKVPNKDKAGFDVWVKNKYDVNNVVELSNEEMNAVIKALEKKPDVN